jgi:hypothetical protein
MKKLVIVAIAVLLALPVMSYAGSATSKWDMTIGGFVNVHFAWADQDVGSGFKTVVRDNGSREVLENTTGNFSSEVQGRLNFIVKGPDAWGAKTMGRLEFDFLGAAATGPQGVGAGTAGTANSQNYGEAYIRHAYMQFDWAQDSLLIGNTWYLYNGIAPGAGLTFQSLPNIMVASRTPQVRYTHRFPFGLSANFALEYPGLMRWMNNNNNYNDRYTQSGYPSAVLNFDYLSDACGKIGPEKLHFGMSGVYGREKAIRATAGTARGTIYSNKQNDGWIFAAYGYVPIIPERNMNKAGALAIQGGYVVGQGLNNYSSAAWPQTYGRSAAFGYTEDFSTPRGYGYYTALTVYAHDKLHFDILYTDTVAQGSNRWANNATQATAQRTTLYNLALMYEPNPAILMGVEYTRLMTKYAQIGYIAGQNGAASRTGTLNGVRLFAQYSF